MATLGERIERARKARGLSKHRLEVLAQLSKGYASRLTNDKRGERPAPGTLRKLADVLQVSYQWLAEERGDMAAPEDAVAHAVLESDMAWPELRSEARKRLVEEIPPVFVDELLDLAGRTPFVLSGSAAATADDVVDLTRVLYAIRLRARARSGSATTRQ